MCLLRVAVASSKNPPKSTQKMALKIECAGAGRRTRWMMGGAAAKEAARSVNASLIKCPKRKHRYSSLLMDKVAAPSSSPPNLRPLLIPEWKPLKKVRMSCDIPVMKKFLRCFPGSIYLSSENRSIQNILFKEF